jgi:hypothetical protein
MKSKRKFTNAFKAKVAVEAIKEQSSLSELSSRYELEVSLLGISHSGYYYVPATESTRNLQIMQAIDKIHLNYPFYGFRRYR